jgi:hypothetical protein
MAMENVLVSAADITHVQQLSKSVSYNITLLTKMARYKNKLVAQAYYMEFDFHFITIHKPVFQ